MKWIKASELQLEEGVEYIAKWKKDFVNNGKYENHTFWFDADDHYRFIARQDFENLYILVPDESLSTETGQQGCEYWKQRCEVAEAFADGEYWNKELYEKWQQLKEKLPQRVIDGL